MISNLRYYLEECCLCENVNKTRENGFPVGTLDDVIIYFMHYSSFGEAKRKWIERCKRVNYNNLYFVMCERDGCEKEDILAFDKLNFKNKVVFTQKPMTEISCGYYIPGSEDGSQVMDLCKYKSKVTRKRWIDDFDYVSFLNG